MARIARAELRLVDLKPLVPRTDAIQSFVSQETPILTLTDEDGASGTGYTYTIGNGGSAITALLRDHLLPLVIGMEAEDIERNWRSLLFSMHALAVGPVSCLALAAIDTALWDLRCVRARLPLHKAVGGAHPSRPVYTTEGGWLHLSVDELVADATEMQARGFLGAKVKIGKALRTDDVERLAAIREAVGVGFELMVDANQGLRLDEAQRRAQLFVDLDLAWIEEPLPADDIGAHRKLMAISSVPIAVGESLYSLSQFKEYMQADACSVVQVDVARIGGITPWLKVAHLADAYNLPVAPHFLMELHVSLACGVPNGQWVEYIPQLESITSTQLEVVDGYAFPSARPGLGIDWDWDAIASQESKAHSLTVI
ncbi:MAG: enolase superfamily enzyme related to L-alanine-DL-glutamate epimerase [Acidimicrobiaceae bacterium]|jgi:L-alanine-DL-glutamate epimerase-like enolase superfamily enzyme|nr:enolase superfamily enzyme related to L-alanine-DL-glutamate epimerase [Acidimicrobiaceae bacterium]